MFRWRCFGFCLVAMVILTMTYCRAQRILPRSCDPREGHRYNACPDGYCCVRDEFLPTDTYCKLLGDVRDNCSTQKFSESECPCLEGLSCQPNIVSAHFVSLYGKCVNATAQEEDDD